MTRKPEKSFLTLANYLCAFNSMLVNSNSTSYQNFFNSINSRITSSGILPNQRIDHVDYNLIKNCLHSAWVTEYLMLITRKLIREGEFIRLSNNWNCIQAYYIFYYSTQALAVAKGHPKPDSHPKTQNIFCTLWGRAVILPPWTFSCPCEGFLNVPPGIHVDTSIHPWTNCDENSAWSLAGKALYTTRREKLLKKEREKRTRKRSTRMKAWREIEKQRIIKGKDPRENPNFRLPHLNHEEKQKIDTDLRPFTIMDYLYRLRIKTNYEDSDMFTDGPTNESDSIKVRDYFCRLASSTIFLHELTICNLVGRNRFENWVRTWIEQNMLQDIQIGLKSRQRFFN